MLIITKDDLDFSALVCFIQLAKKLGEIERNGKVLQVMASDKLVFLCQQSDKIDEIAVIPVRSFDEASDVMKTLKNDSSKELGEELEH